MLTQRMLAHVPLLLHPDPTRAAIIGSAAASRWARR
jgi:spermidine synthase